MTRFGLVSFVTTSIEDVACGVGPEDKFWLACARSLRPLTYAINAASRALGTRAINPHVFLRRDVTLRTEHGLFHCRRETSDFGVCSVTHEPELNAYFAINDGVFLDIGANIGKWSVSVARRMGGRGRVVAVEAEPRTFSVLRRNIDANHLTNVTAIWAAATTADGELRIHAHKWGTGLHTLEGLCDPSQTDFAPAVAVPARSIDSIVSELGLRNIQLIKIDVESAEFDVLLGAAQTLAREESVRVVIEASGSPPLDYLRGQGFRITRLNERQDYLAERPRPSDPHTQ